MFTRKRQGDKTPVERRISRKIYAYGVLNTITDKVVSLLPAEDKTTAHLETGERNWHSDEFHVVIPLVIAPRYGTLEGERNVA